MCIKKKMEQYSFLETLLRFEEHFSFPTRYPLEGKLCKLHIQEKLQCDVAICSKSWWKLMQHIEHKPNLNMYLIWHQQVWNPRYVNPYSDLLEVNVFIFIFTGLYLPAISKYYCLVLYKTENKNQVWKHSKNPMYS